MLLSCMTAICIVHQIKKKNSIHHELAFIGGQKDKVVTEKSHTNYWADNIA